MSKLQPVRGTHDLLPDEYRRFAHVVGAARDVARLYGYREMATPIFEFTELFARGIGETTDVVSKEMYTFKDRGDESLTLRPEYTAGICRAFISNGELTQQLPLKVFAAGPMFRYERPQKGRQRQFHQIDIEVLGAPEPGAEPFVTVGQHVAADSTVCIIEVMKLMNSIPAGRAGTVTHVLVADSQPVEFNQVLAVIAPDA